MDFAILLSSETTTGTFSSFTISGFWFGIPTRLVDHLFQWRSFSSTKTPGQYHCPLAPHWKSNQWRVIILPLGIQVVYLSKLPWSEGENPYTGHRWLERAHSNLHPRWSHGSRIFKFSIWFWMNLAYSCRQMSEKFNYSWDCDKPILQYSALSKWSNNSEHAVVGVWWGEHYLSSLYSQFWLQRLLHPIHYLIVLKTHYFSIQYGI